jgi:hypothetical protein
MPPLPTLIRHYAAFISAITPDIAFRQLAATSPTLLRYEADATPLILAAEDIALFTFLSLSRLLRWLFATLLTPLSATPDAIAATSFAIR